MFIGERLAELRKDRGLTQGQLAEKTGIARDSISAYERSRFYPGSYAIVVFARFFNVSLDYLHGLTDEETTFYRTKFIVLPEDSSPEVKLKMQEYLAFLMMK